MPRHVVEITRREEFSAAHRLHNPSLTSEQNRALYGICNNENGHGHNYEFEVTVRGMVDAETGMVMNLTDLMKLMRDKIVARVDHKHLNHDVEFLAGVIPTAENVTVAIWLELEPEVRRFAGCRLSRVRLYESRSSLVEYCGPEVQQ